MSSTHTGKQQPSRLGLSRQTSRRRLFAVLLVCIAMFAAVVGRLTQLQLISSEKYASLGESQRVHSVKLPAERGSIFDRNGRDLALSVPQQTIWADPREIKTDADLIKVSSMLAPVLDKNPYDLQREVKGYIDRKKSFMYIARRVDDDTAKRVKDMDLPGIHMYEESKRFLPAGDMLESLVGQVGVDNEGRTGLEFQYDKDLSGKPGTMVGEFDAFGRAIPGGLRKEKAPARGDDLILTVDSDLQYKVETALAHEIDIANAKGGMAAIMDVRSGEVLAMANLTVPNNGRGKPVKSASNNMVLTNVYEPGSVSKLITIGAALELGLVNPSTNFSVPEQTKVADTMFHDAEEHPTENWTTTDILAASSNVGTIGIAQKLGAERLDKFQRAFGYGSTTGLGFPGEAAGLILSPKSKGYSGTSLATSAIGQGVSVTAMQMLAAYNTIANEGTYVAPKLVKATVDAEGKTRPTEPSATHRVVSEETAAQMNLMLQEVVSRGTGSAAQISGYEVAGKTGTAGKPRTDGPGYANYVSTFAGFLPAAAPKFTAIVILDEPTPIFGGLVAAPVFADITRYALESYNVGPVPWGDDHHGVPHTQESARSAAGTNDATPGITAADAEAATQAATSNRAAAASSGTNSSGSSTSSSSSSSTSSSSTSSTTKVPPSRQTAAGFQTSTTSTTIRKRQE